MIENPYPSDWRQLQAGVCQLFNEIGLTAETEKKVTTPRGEIGIDVYAVDENSVDKIRYATECKNWASAVPQHVVHSFMTVMQETGANVGFIVSREGLQKGAERFTKNTNIVGLTFLELQRRYFDVWWNRYFVPVVAGAADDLVQYVEPINSRRERFLEALGAPQQAEFLRLREKNYDLGMLLAFVVGSQFLKRTGPSAPSDIGSFKEALASHLGPDFVLKSEYFRDLAHELAAIARRVTEPFNEVFGENIFSSSLHR